MQHGGGAQSYGQPPSHGQAPQYGGPPPPGPPSMDQTLPPGWAKQWDSNSQRWYFVEHATGRTQWEPPMPMGQNYGHQVPGYGQQDTYPPGVGQYDQHGSVKKDKGMGTMGAAAGGLAVGAIGGGLVGHAMGRMIHFFSLCNTPNMCNTKRSNTHKIGDDSDDDKYGAPQYAAQPSSGYGQSGYGQQPMQQPYGDTSDPYSQQPPAAGALPDETHDGDSVSNSDKEDVEDAQEDYQEALRDGDASDIEEAREDYHEEYEETYDD